MFEPPKAGLTATVPVPGPLWQSLIRLAEEREAGPALPWPAGMLLFREENPRFEGTNSIGALDNTNYREKVWIPARIAAGLNGDLDLPVLDPRRGSVKVKDLRAFAASVLLDAGASRTEAAMLLRHSNTATTERHYARAMAGKAHDSARRAVSIDKTATLAERLDALWDAWVTAFPEVLDALGIPAYQSDERARHLRLIVNPDAPDSQNGEGHAQVTSN